MNSNATSENDQPKPTRKRIPLLRPPAIAPLIDPLSYTSNKCTLKAKEICTVTEKVIINLWGDKHYFDRHFQGDENGRRDGIDPLTIESLVKRSVKHLLLYGATVKGFRFVNFPESPDPGIRIILQEEYNSTMLNVVIETHFVNINTYEITVVTAQCVDDFRAQIGQFAIELQGDASILKKKENKYGTSDLTEIASFWNKKNI
jgi:hypothetical protein